MDSHVLSFGIFLGVFLLFIITPQCQSATDESHKAGPANVVGGKLRCHQCNVKLGTAERTVNCNKTTIELNCAVCMKIETTIITGRRKPKEWETHYDTYEVTSKICLENALDARTYDGCFYNQGAQGYSTVCYCSGEDLCNHGNRPLLSLATIISAAISIILVRLI